LFRWNFRPLTDKTGGNVKNESKYSRLQLSITITKVTAYEEK